MQTVDETKSLCDESSGPRTLLFKISRPKGLIVKGYASKVCCTFRIERPRREQKLHTHGGYDQATTVR